MHFISVFLLSLIVGAFSQTTCPTAPSEPEDRRTNKSQLVIAEFNVEWLFINYLKSANCPGAGCAWKNSTAALNHLNDIALAIKFVNADIFMLAEVEDCDVLKMLQTAVGDSTYKYYLVKGTDTATGQNTALFTRVDPSVNLQRTSERVAYPVPGSKCGYDGQGDTGVSKHFWTQFTIEGMATPLVMIGAHLIAFPDVPDRCSQREAQATVLSDLATLQARNNDFEYVILGDFNDYDSTILDTAGDVPISMALQILKSDSNGEVVMTNAASEISSQSNRWSSWYDKNDNCVITPNEKTLIDHILLSPGLVNSITDVTIVHDAFAASCDTYYSDHWPVTVTLSTPTSN